jgi:oligopeptide transport system ATP-binding protein
MYAGRIVEEGPTAAVLRRARHPYTRGLLDSLPHPDAGEQPLVPIGGTPPSPTERPAGCAFHPRCRYALDRCRVEVPRLLQIESERAMACPVDPLVPVLVA